MKETMLKVVSAEARRKLGDQLNAVDSIDQKIGSILGFAGVILVLAFNKTPDQPYKFLLYSLSQISFLVSIFILFCGYRSIRLETGLSIKGYLEEIKELEPKKDFITFIKHQILYFQKAINTNNDLMKQKNICLHHGTVMLLSGLVLYVITTLM